MSDDGLSKSDAADGQGRDRAPEMLQCVCDVGMLVQKRQSGPNCGSPVEYDIRPAGYLHKPAHQMPAQWVA